MNINFGPFYSKYLTGFSCTDEELAPIYSAIKEAEGRAKERTLNPYKIYMALSAVDDLLPVSKQAKEGVVVYCDPNAQDFPNAYKYTPMSTHFEAVFRSGRWYIVGIFRQRCTNKFVVVEHTASSLEALIAAHSIIRR